MTRFVEMVPFRTNYQGFSRVLVLKNDMIYLDTFLVKVFSTHKFDVAPGL